MVIFYEHRKRTHGKLPKPESGLAPPPPPPELDSNNFDPPFWRKGRLHNLSRGNYSFDVHGVGLFFSRTM